MQQEFLQSKKDISPRFKQPFNIDQSQVTIRLNVEELSTFYPNQVYKEVNGYEENSTMCPSMNPETEEWQY